MEQFLVDEISSSYWRVSFDNGPINLFDADSIVELAELLTRIETDPALTVVVFESANPDFFIAHWDGTADAARVAAMAPGPTGLHPYLDNFVRLSKVPAVTVSAIRGRARGAGSEFVLATDVRFAGDSAILGQFEVGFGAVPGGGAMPLGIRRRIRPADRRFRQGGRHPHQGVARRGVIAARRRAGPWARGVLHDSRTPGERTQGP
jgi:enoyl-CoA hydratase/carnithine racemase